MEARAVSLNAPCLPDRSSPLRTSLLSAAFSSDFKNKNFDSHVSLQFPISLLPLAARQFSSRLSLLFPPSSHSLFSFPSDSGEIFHTEKLKKWYSEHPATSCPPRSNNCCHLPRRCARTHTHAHGHLLFTPLLEESKPPPST